MKTSRLGWAGGKRGQAPYIFVMQYIAFFICYFIYLPIGWPIFPSGWDVHVRIRWACKSKVVSFVRLTRCTHVSIWESVGLITNSCRPSLSRKMITTHNACCQWIPGSSCDHTGLFPRRKYIHQKLTLWILAQAKQLKGFLKLDDLKPHWTVEVGATRAQDIYCSPLFWCFTGRNLPSFWG